MMLLTYFSLGVVFLRLDGGKIREYAAAVVVVFCVQNISSVCMATYI